MKLESRKYDCRWTMSVAIIVGVLGSPIPAGAQSDDEATQPADAVPPAATTAPETEPSSAASPVAQPSETTADVPVAESREEIEDIVITGYRSSVERALLSKRVAVNARETIVAGDLAKIPDLNLAEAIQRVPGVAISREGGEGRQVTLRGLGPEFTRVTLNGMEVPASTDGLDSSGGLNAGRAFDFNVFASELFNRIDINKSPTASIEEGGLAGSVDLSSPHPFDQKGFRVTGSAKGGFNTLTQTVDPRVAALVSNTFFDDTFGVLASVAYTQRTVRQEGFGTVRWQSPNNNGRTWADTSNTTVIGSPAPGLDINDIQVPRLPRLDFFGNEQDRLGITASAQWRPSKRFNVTVDYLRSQFNNRRESYNFDGQFRNFFDSITPNSITIGSDGRSATAAQFSNVLNRTESRLVEADTTFNQIVGNIDFSIDDTKKLHFLAGYAQSEASTRQWRFNIITGDPTGGPNGDGLMADPNNPDRMITIRRTHDFGYDFNQGEAGNFPALTYGYDILDPNQYVWDSDTFVGRDVVRDNITTGLDFEWSSGFANVNVGVRYNDRTVDSVGLNLEDPGIPANSVIPNVTRALPVDNFGSGIAPGGVPNSYLVNDFDATIEAYGLPEFAVNPASGNTFQIQERIISAHMELNAEAELLGRPLRVNGGVRVARTLQNSRGTTPDTTQPNNVAPVEIERSYVDVLPSANFVWEVYDDLLFRTGISRSMTRPGLGSLSPSFTATPVNQTFNGGNPFLDPIRSNNVDVALEYYFFRNALIGVSFFYKDIESFIATATEEGILDPQFQEIIRNDPNFDPSFGDPSDTQYTISSPVNNDGSELSGVEVAVQVPLGFFSEYLEGFGLLGNYTYVDSESEFGSGANIITTSLLGLSNHSYNLTFFYENTDLGFGGRVSVNGRSKFITRVPGRNGGPDGTFSESTDGTTNVDFLLYYDIIDNITVALEGFNMTDQRERLFTTGAGNEDLVREFNHTGRQFFLGIRGRL